MKIKSEQLNLALASASPRRRDLLALTGWEAVVVPAHVDEQPRAEETAVVLAHRLAKTKAIQAASERSRADVVLAADTVVVNGDRLLGKPESLRQAVQMLMALRDLEHRVVTAVVVLDRVDGKELVEICETIVPMRAYSHEEVHAYIDSERPFDKAGGYGIQDEAFRLVAVERLYGCYANVMGLPLCHLVRALRRLGHDPPQDVPEACQKYTGYTCPVYSEILGKSS